MSVRVAGVADPVVRAADTSRLRHGIGRAARRDRFALAAALVLVGAAVVALLAPWLPLPDPDALDTPNRLPPPLSPGHRLGTDEFGRHILPHLLSPVIVAFSLDVGAKILATAGLSFLGLGTQPPTADWGSMLATGRQFVVLSPHVVLLPGLAIFVVVLALNLVGDALRDLLDPRTHER